MQTRPQCRQRGSGRLVHSLLVSSRECVHQYRQACGPIRHPARRTALNAEIVVSRGTFECCAAAPGRQFAQVPRLLPWLERSRLPYRRLRLSVSPVPGLIGTICPQPRSDRFSINRSPHFGWTRRQHRRARCAGAIPVSQSADGKAHRHRHPVRRLPLLYERPPSRIPGLNSTTSITATPTTPITATPTTPTA